MEWFVIGIVGGLGVGFFTGLGSGIYVTHKLMKHP